MTAQSDFDIQAPRLERSVAPCKGIPFRPYTYRGDQPWTPKTSR